MRFSPLDPRRGFFCEQIADLNHEIIHEILTKSAPWGFFYICEDLNHEIVFYYSSLLLSYIVIF